MQPSRISLITLIVLSASVTNAFAPNLPAPVFASPVLARTSVTGQAEAY
jgi:hypothetical protein